MHDNEEVEIKKGYDKQLLKRLLAYAKPYMAWITVSLILLIGVVGADLVKPILVGNAVDDIITKYDTMYSIVDEDTEGAIKVKDVYLVSDEKNKYTEARKAGIIYDDAYEKPYFLISDIDISEISLLSNVQKVSSKDGKYYISYNNVKKEVISLNDGEIGLLRNDHINGLVKITIIFIVVLILGLVITYLQTILLNYTGQKIIYNIRNDVFTHIQNLSIQFFNNNPVGKLVTRVTNDTETLNEMYTSVIVNSVKSVLMLTGISVMMFILEWRLTLAIFLVIPLLIISTMLFRHFSRKAYREVRTKVAAINAFLSEHISGMRIVQIFSQEKRKMNEFKKANGELKNANMKQLIVFGVYRPSMYLIYVIGLAIVLTYGGNMVIKGTMSIGKLIIFIQYISNFFDPIQQLAEQFNILQSAMASSEKIFTLLDEDSIIDNKEDSIKLDKINGNIEFKNVWFAYNEGEWVLKDVSFRVSPGETVAFVGATGAGKTSILNLISRYYDIQKGEILIDGYNVKDLDLKCLRSSIGQMLQDVFLFTGNINSNVRLKNNEITDGKIKKASKYVNADKFIQKLPDKYNEKVYERGATFSSGQRQLLSFARTLAFSPSILILDEATANIDTETELLIQDALYKLMEGRTTLVVAHRLSTIQHADKIIVLHKGRVREIGNHQELLAKKGIYHNLYELQYQEIN
ncbi:lipid A ABC transporter permease/ATP-binding protein [Vallitalea longa]|uniref:Lipid A ABC transporter permease/ATP-binding protein n=1 Tax=Vallitalea longa TaxID=2936439 RepID=A0A9W6DH14_9FIRM|nr:ABC transporter ATP-binding protein [Vallitalea longa]GKX30379.1 lipid A ABC transporter permease/ATP-binding protein [Vallitalea longa]